MTKLLALVATVTALASPVLAADNAVVVAQARQYQPVGSYDFTYMAIPVYHAVLLAPGGRYDPTGAYALQITYKLGLQGTAIANRGLAEMKKQGHSAAERNGWKPVLVAMIPNVANGETLTALHPASGGLVMERGLAAKGGAVSGSSADAKLGQAFFDIWLGEKTTTPDQRKALLGNK